MRTSDDFRVIETEFYDEQPLKSICLFCEWTFEGTAVESRAAALDHRAQAHPDRNKKRSKRHMRTLSSFRYVKLEEEERSEIEQERRKRAYIHGVEIE